MTTRYRVIDDALAKEITRLRKKHPNLGHEGLHRVLADAGINVPEAELKMFLRQKNWRPESAGTKIPPASVTRDTLSLGLLNTTYGANTTTPDAFGGGGAGDNGGDCK